MSKKPDHTKDRLWTELGLKHALETLISQGLISLYSEVQKPKAAYKVACNHYTGFADERFGYEYFRSRLYATRQQLQERKSRAEEDYKDFVEDMKIVKKSTTTNRGLPRWNGSEAERWQKIDMDNCVHYDLKPKDFWLSRQCFQVFSLRVFRNHIYQYDRSKKYENFWKHKLIQKELKAGKKAADKEAQAFKDSLPPGAEFPGGGEPPQQKKKRQRRQPRAAAAAAAAAAALPPHMIDWAAIDLTRCISDNESHSDSDDDSDGL
jgi:hypothetical protein